MKMRLFTFFIYALIFSFCSVSKAEDIPARPSPERLVNDLANILDYQTTEELERTLVAFDDTTSTQICVVTLTDLNGYSASEMAYEIGEQWGVGQKGKNNGIVVLVKPKTQEERGRAFIATGYGLEGVLPDAICTRIVNQTMIPHFQNNDYQSGIIAGVNDVIKYVTGEYTQEENDDEEAELVAFVTICFLIFIVILVCANKNDRGKRHITRSTDAAWIIGNILNNSSHRGSWGGGSYGGGFGGFGGGSFGGGGGGGSW